MINIMCVLKKGGEYDARYVSRLAQGLQQWLTVPYKLVCLTDDKEVDCCETIPLKHNWPGWWSKIELFRPDLGECQSLYLDLDTMIIGNIDKLLDVAGQVSFAALRGFNTRYGKSNKNFASGIMVGNFSFYPEVYHRFLENPKKHMAESRPNWRHGDQGFISSVMGLCIPKLQIALPKDYIVGKRKAIEDNFGLPNTRIIAWSGQPRFHKAKEKFIVNYWNN